MTKRMGPGDVPGLKPPVQIAQPDEDDERELGTVMTREDAAAMAKFVTESKDELAKLRAPFPPEMIEKLPKPLWKNAWTDQPKGHCDVCHGYHPLANTIHLDYVGHANTTNRLLEVDPFWEWEPMALTEQGTPLFTDNGLWIKLTVCGMTRLGFGDGGSVKEVIGDAIRNAAMRFGVALDLWSKIDLHAERNPGDGPTRQAQVDNRASARGRAQARGEGAGAASRAEPPRAPNQDALDELLSICDENGLDPRAVEATYNDKYAPPVLVKASPDDIRNYRAILLAQMEAGPASGRTDSEDIRRPEPADDSDEAQAGPGVHDQPADVGAGDVGAVASDESDAGVHGGVDPTDTSDVEKKPGDLF